MKKREGSRTLLWATRLLDHRWSLGILPGSPLGVWLKKRDKATICIDIHYLQVAEDGTITWTEWAPAAQ